MSNIYVSSDYHLNHDKEFIWKARGFSCVEEMNEAIVERNNSLVKKDDILIICGDLMLGGADNLEKGMSLLQRMNGRKLVVGGNHDTPTRRKAYLKAGIPVFDAYSFTYHKYHFYCSHYPTLCSNYDVGKALRAKTLNLCGHSHVTDPFADWDKGCIYHCEVDAHECYPISLDNIIEEMKEKVYDT